MSESRVTSAPAANPLPGADNLQDASRRSATGAKSLAVALWLDALVPGAGSMYLGRVRQGLIWLAASIVVTAGAILALGTGANLTAIAIACLLDPNAYSNPVCVPSGSMQALLRLLGYAPFIWLGVRLWALTDQAARDEDMSPRLLAAAQSPRLWRRLALIGVGILVVSLLLASWQDVLGSVNAPLEQPPSSFMDSLTLLLPESLPAVMVAVTAYLLALFRLWRVAWWRAAVEALGMAALVYALVTAVDVGFAAASAGDNTFAVGAHLLYPFPYLARWPALTQFVLSAALGVVCAGWAIPWRLIRAHDQGAPARSGRTPIVALLILGIALSLVGDILSGAWMASLMAPLDLANSTSLDQQVAVMNFFQFLLRSWTFLGSGVALVFTLGFSLAVAQRLAPRSPAAIGEAAPSVDLRRVIGAGGFTILRLGGVADASTAAIYRSLRHQFGPKRVGVYDEAADSAPDHGVAHALRKAAAFVVIIGPHALTGSSAPGGQALDNPISPLRQMLRQALQAPRYEVYPVVVDGASMPTPHDLPADLAGLAYLNAAIIQAPQRYDADFSRLTDSIRNSVRLSARPNYPGLAKLCVAVAALSLVAGSSLFVPFMWSHAAQSGPAYYIQGAIAIGYFLTYLAVIVCWVVEWIWAFVLAIKSRSAGWVMATLLLGVFGPTVPLFFALIGPVAERA